jgi:hypothetical protein
MGNGVFECLPADCVQRGKKCCPDAGGKKTGHPNRYYIPGTTVLGLNLFFFEQEPAYLFSGTWCPGTWCQIFILDILIKYPFLNIFLLASDRALTLLKNGRQKFVKESSRPVSPSSPMKGRRLRLAARGYFVL